MDLLGLGALGLVTAEWLALGYLSGVAWPARAGELFWVPRWGLRLLVGACLVSLVQLLGAVFGVGFGSIPLVLLGSAVAASGLRVTRTRSVTGKECDLESKPLHARERLGWLLLGGVLLAAIIRALLVPEAGWDAYSHWGLRAQAYALTGNIMNAHSEHEYYPPLVPLLEAWLYMHRGSASIDFGKTVWAVVGSAFCVCLAWHLSLSLSPRARWLAPWCTVAIVASTTMLLESFWTGQADLALTAFLSLTTLALLQLSRRPDRAWLVQATIFAAAAALTKFEGLPRVGVLVAAVVVEYILSNNKPLDGVKAAAIVTAAAGTGALLWLVAAARYDLPSNAEHFGQFQPSAIGSVLSSLAEVFGGVRTGGGVLVAAVAWAVAGRRLPRLLALVVVGQLAATLVAFLFSDIAPDIEVRTSATRLVEQFLPLALFAGAVGLAEVLGGTRASTQRLDAQDNPDVHGKPDVQGEQAMAGTYNPPGR